jgi:two-component system, NarL family, nitrate/nitrite response regulator NarL
MNAARSLANAVSVDPVAVGNPIVAETAAARRVLLAHRGRLGADGLRALIERANLNFEVQTVGTCRQALDLMARQPEFDLALITVAAGAIPELEAIGAFAAAHPETPIVVVIPDEAVSCVAGLIRRGVRGAVLESAPGSTLATVLQFVLLGGVYVPSAPAEGQIYLAPPGTKRGPHHGLTPRQADVLRLVARGLSNKAISRALAMQESTVKAHVNHIMRKLKVRNRTQAALVASQSALAVELHS